MGIEQKDHTPILPFCVEPIGQNPIGLYHKGNGLFRLYRVGDFEDMLLAHQYVLVRDTLAQFLADNSTNDVDFSEAVIYRQKTGERWTEYRIVRPSEEVTPGTIHKADATGLKLWHFDFGTLFVSPELKDLLEKAQWHLRFQVGFWWNRQDRQKPQPYPSTRDATFQDRVAKWISDNGEILAVIRFPYTAGSKSFEFFTSMDEFGKKLSALPWSTCVTVLGTPQLSLRGRIDDTFISRAQELVPDGDEWLIVGLEEAREDSLAWFRDYDGYSHEELQAELREAEWWGELAAFGAYPPWHKDSELVVSAVVPNPDDSVFAAAY